MPRQKKKVDQADAVVHVPLPRDDMDACVEAIKGGLFEAVREIDRINATRNRKHKLRMPAEFAFLDAASNKEFVFPASGSPQWHPSRK